MTMAVEFGIHNVQANAIAPDGDSHAYGRSGVDAGAENGLQAGGRADGTLRKAS